MTRSSSPKPIAVPEPAGGHGEGSVGLADVDIGVRTVLAILEDPRVQERLRGICGTERKIDATGSTMPPPVEEPAVIGVARAAQIFDCTEDALRARIERGTVGPAYGLRRKPGFPIEFHRETLLKRLARP